VLPAASPAAAIDERIVRIVIQPRPPTDDPLLAAGEFQWQDFHPQGPWKARYLLTARDPLAITSTETPRTLFTELVANCDQEVKFALESGRGPLHPTLIYYTEEPLPQTISVHLDGQRYDQVRIYASCGFLPLPPIPRDRAKQARRLFIGLAGKSRVFMNCIHPDGRPTYWKRLANRLQDGRLSFVYEKQGEAEEVLTLRFYPAAREQRRLRFYVTISDSTIPTPGPLDSWTIRHRSYDLRPGTDASVLVLEARDALTDGGMACYLPLGSDLPPGEYRIDVQLEGATNGYVLLSRSTPGLVEKRSIYLEQSDDGIPLEAPQGRLGCFP
jgi:hypothetical protein